MNSTKLAVLLILCLQNSIFTVLRRYSQGILNEQYSKYEVLLFGEVVKMGFSAWMISGSLQVGESVGGRLTYLTQKCAKMAVLAGIYGCMNILSFVALRNIGAGTFTIFAQCKILTTASFSKVMLNKTYSWAQWRALLQLMVGVLLFSASIFEGEASERGKEASGGWGPAMLGTAAVLVEVTLSGFASIYFEKVIKLDPEQLGIWERNYQLALGSIPIYVLFILHGGGGEVGYGGGWSGVAIVLACLGAAGGLLVALSIKHGDSILKTLATTGSILLSSLLDHYLLFGPLTFVMVMGGINVVLAICNYTFDATPKQEVSSVHSNVSGTKKEEVLSKAVTDDEKVALTKV
uniref:UDP-galactose transporter n=1 Tax=Leptocylindrus danicus TaxID=163516 RepID=A0A7S2LF34_9STRA